jgi:hypothetical protein
VRPEGLVKFKNSPHRISNRRLPVCSIVPQRLRYRVLSSISDRKYLKRLRKITQTLQHQSGFGWKVSLRGPRNGLYWWQVMTKNDRTNGPTRHRRVISDSKLTLVFISTRQQQSAEEAVLPISEYVNLFPTSFRKCLSFVTSHFLAFSLPLNNYELPAEYRIQLQYVVRPL